MSQEAQDVKSLEKLFEAVAGSQFVASARIMRVESEKVLELDVQYSQKDPRTNSTMKIQQTMFKSGDRQGLWRKTSPVILQKCLGAFKSPSGALTAMVTPGDGKGDSPSFKIVITTKEGEIVSTISTEGKHSKIFLGGTFGGLSWSPNEKYIAYIAEPKAEKRPNYFEASEEKKEKDKGEEKDTKKEDSKISPGSSFEYREAWGEILTDAFSPKPFVADIEKRTVVPICDAPKTVSFGQLCWAPEGNGVVCVGWPEDPRRLGVTYYNTRKSALYFAPFDVDTKAKEEGTDKEKGKPSNWEILTPDDHSTSNPRFSPDGKQLAYLTTDNVWFHKACSRLRVMSWPERKVRTVVDVLRKPADDKAFPGLWPYGLPERPWLGDSHHLVFHSQWRTKWTPLCVDTRTGKIRRLIGSAALENIASLLVTDVLGSSVLIKACTPTTHHELHLVEVLLKDLKEDSSESKSAKVEVMPATWECVRPPTKLRDPGLQAQLDKCDIQVLEVKGDKKEKFEAILLIPPCDKKKEFPLVLRPHGGPHSAFSTLFDWGNVMMLLRGFAVVCVNYRGSTGYGEEFLESLPGKCGRQDVDDCISSLEKAISVCKTKGITINEKRIMVWGGSHGGFLVTHLIGQFPNRFFRCATRNPVTNVAYMVTQTDIPDWCYVEGGMLDYSSKKIPTASDYAKFYAMSPISHASKVCTPVLMLLGMKDLRVPPSQGLNYHRLLKSRGVRTKCLTYPESTHSLSDSVRTEGDVWINVLRWFEETS